MMPREGVERHQSGYGRLAAAAIGLALVCSAADAAETLQESRFTEVINIVEVLPPASSAAAQVRRPRVNDMFRSPEILQTGRASRAELLATDATVTRIGANSVFSFEPKKERSIFLQKGSLLFHSPKGRGGGTIRTASATASVLGTTIIVVATNNGGFKVMVLEGRAKVTLPNGRYSVVRAGQLVFVLPGSKQLSPPLVFRLAQQIRGSQLVQGFEAALASTGRILDAVSRQEGLIQNGQLELTDFLIGQTQGGEEIELVQFPASDIQNTIMEGSHPASETSLPYEAIEPPVAEPSPALGLWEFHLPGIVSAPPLAPTHTVTGQQIIDDPTAGNALDATLQGTYYEGLGTTVPIGASDALFVGTGVDFAVPSLDLSTFASASFIGFIAGSTMDVPGSLVFSGFAGDLGLFSHGILSMASGATIDGGAASLLHISSGSALSLDNVDLTANSGDLLVDSGGVIGAQGGQFSAADRIEIDATGAVTLDGTAFDAQILIISGAGASLNNADFGGVIDATVDVTGSLGFSGSFAPPAHSLDLQFGTLAGLPANLSVSGALSLYANSGTLTASGGLLSGGEGASLGSDLSMSLLAATVEYAGTDPFSAVSLYSGQSIWSGGPGGDLTLDATTVRSHHGYAYIIADGGSLTMQNGSAIQAAQAASLTTEGSLGISDSTLESGGLDIGAGTGVTFTRSSFTEGAASAYGFNIYSGSGPRPVTFEDADIFSRGAVSIANPSGHVDVRAGSQLGSSSAGVAIDASSARIDGSTLSAATGITIDSIGALDILSGSQLSASDSVRLIGTPVNVSGATIQSTGPSETLQMESRDGNIDVQNTSLVGNEVLISSANPTTYQIVRLNLLNGSISGNRAEMVARDMLTANGIALGAGLADIRMQADTLALQNINFPGGSTVNLGSRLGLLAPNANTGQPVQNGYVNYISNVRYNGTLLDNTPHGNISIYAIP